MIIGLLSLILNFYSVHANPNRGLIIGGSPAPSYDFFAVPQMQNGVLCGSTLVHPDILVTAAHCAALFEDEVFYIGASKIDGSDAIDTIGVQEIRIHPEFDLQGLEDEMNGFVQVGSASLLHDIALIKLQSESKATPAEWNSGPGWVQPGDSVKVVGFGSDENGSIPYYLVEVNVEVVDEYICERIYDGFSEIVGDLQICAGKTDAGACVGDSGGPLLYNDVLIGVVSFGLILEDGSCESGNFPDVYTRTSGYAEFIESGICDLSGVPPASCQSGIQSNAPTWHFSKLPTLFPMNPTDVVSSQVPTVVSSGDTTDVADISKLPIPPLTTESPSRSATTSPTVGPNTVDRSNFSAPPRETSFPSESTPIPSSWQSDEHSRENSNSPSSSKGSQTEAGVSSGTSSWQQQFLVFILLVCAFVHW